MTLSREVNRGFTLIEMVVVLAVVAILAAILTPTIAKNINDAKLARATNETQVIASAIGSFFKDLGRWPTSNGSDANHPDSVRLLYGPGTIPTDGASAVIDDENWLVGGTLVTGNEDTFSNQLIANTPGGLLAYSTTGTELKWKGPYLNEIKADPWGNYYGCNIYYTYNSTTNAVGVWSAGPDRTTNTAFTATSVSFAVGGDDIIARIQ